MPGSNANDPHTLPQPTPAATHGWGTDEVAGSSKGGSELVLQGLWDRLSPERRSAIQVISSRVRTLQEKPRVLILNDMFNDPEVRHLANEESRKRFAALVFVSSWQASTYHFSLRVPYSSSLILPNAIEPIPEHQKPSGGPVRLIYHTTPHRGLELLVPVVEQLVEKDKLNLSLDVYSSFDAYGWQGADRRYEPLYAKIKSLPYMAHHGFQPNSVVREALTRAHVFAYPCIWPETSCIALIEALSAGCSCLVPTYGALPETGSIFATQYPWTEDTRVHARRFKATLKALIEDLNSNAQQNKLLTQRAHTNQYYAWDTRLPQWNALIDGILARAR